MKILIVDDEQPICDWLQFTINSLPISCEIIGVAVDGATALELFEAHLPDVILTDINLPIMDGLDFIRALNKYSNPCYIIVLSNHDNFSYAREAFTLNVQKYILKTEIDRDGILQLLTEAESYLKTNTKALHQSSYKFKLDLMVKNILTNKDISQKQILEIFRMPETLMDNSSFFAVCARLKNTLSLDQEIELPDIEYISHIHMICIDDYTLIFLANITSAPSILLQTSTIFSFASKIQRFYNATVGISTIYQDLSHLPKAILQSTETLDSVFFSNSIATNYESYFLMGNDTYQFQTEALFSAIKNGDKKKVLEEISTVFTTVRKHMPISRKELIHMCKTIDYSLLVAHYHEDFTSIIKEYEDFCTCIENVSDLEQMQLEIESLCAHLLDDPEALCYSYHVSKSIRYLNDHFSEQITLQDMSALTHLSPEYFCRLFKSETALTFNQYLCKLRMEHAIKLLAEKQYKIKDISLKCGYMNVNYFSKVFKDYTGFTPAEYLRKI